MGDVLAGTAHARRSFTVDEYHRMGEAGILTAGDRVELIEGDVITMTPIGQRHVVCVAELLRRLVLALGDRAAVWPRSPIRLSPDTEPQPDVALLRPRSDRYLREPAGGEDVLLVVEVAETSYRYDRGLKPGLYARAGVREVWIVDLAGDAVEVHRGPGPQGYTSSERIGRGGTVAPAVFPDVVLAVTDVLPPR